MCHLRDDEDLAKVLEVCFATHLVACRMRPHLLCTSFGYTTIILTLCAVLFCPVGLNQCIDLTGVGYLGPSVNDSLLKGTSRFAQELLAATVHLAQAQIRSACSCNTSQLCPMINSQVCLVLKYGSVSQESHFISKKFAFWMRYQVTRFPVVVMRPVQDQVISRPSQCKL